MLSTNIFLRSSLVCLIDYAQYNDFYCILYFPIFLPSCLLLPGLCFALAIASAYNAFVQFCALLAPSYSASLASDVASSESPSLTILFKQLLYHPPLYCLVESFTALITICNYFNFFILYISISGN